MINAGLNMQNRFPITASFGSTVNDAQKTAPQTVTQPSADKTDSVELNNKKVEDFKTRLKDKNWEKKYNPEFKTVRMKQKRIADGLEYSISSDGTVTETGLKIKPTIIITEDKDALDLYNKKSKPKSLKNRISNFWKRVKAAATIANATGKGVLYGAATGTALLGGSWLFKSLPAALTKEGPTLWNTIRHPLKHIGTSGKVIAAIGSAIVLGYHIVKGKLDANQKTAVIDHKLKTGHRDK